MWRQFQGSSERYKDIKAQVERSLALARTHHDHAEIAFCLWTLGTLAENFSGMTEALALLEESLAVYSSLDDSFYMARAADYLGAAYLRSNRLKVSSSLSKAWI